MYKFTKLPTFKENDFLPDTTGVTLELKAESLDELCVAFTDFLKGCGFGISPYETLEVVPGFVATEYDDEPKVVATKLKAL